MSKRNNASLKQILKVFLSKSPMTFCQSSLKGLNNDRVVQEICKMEDPNKIHMAVSNLLIDDYGFTDKEMSHYLIPYMKPFKTILIGINNVKNVVRRDSVRGNVKGLIFYIYLGIIIKKFKSIHDFL